MNWRSVCKARKRKRKRMLHPKVSMLTKLGKREYRGYLDNENEEMPNNLSEATA